MALHRDIFWIGRQWAVTGHGMQLVDQRLMGAFDIEVARLWDDDLMGRMRAKEWLNAADFDKALAFARTRHSQPQAGSTSVAAPPIPAIEPIAPPIEPPKQQSPDLQLKIDGQARFARPWRVWMKRKT
ncbi:hypothetical protein IVB30_18915 [Bradyrhizobium sp. 200]|uniref:hypothetical protein n=1 Tax=Bradyrhizobium sp. 200 TaxID=2782665 RepID=UPI001FFEA459|nr:hypothetical protein [Bradyrhizobium sp. 200]UPJ53199.1 hypothetical protein IVB30_18915 [Bradyrhizobium sp. 200]